MLKLTGLDADDVREIFFAAFPQARDQIPPKTDQRWKALFEFLDRPWFSRLWVFQEAILSVNEVTGSVVVGQMTFDFFHLYLARSLLYVDWKVEKLPVVFEMVKHLMQFYLHRNSGFLPPISFTVWQIGWCLGSQDPRDRIYMFKIRKEILGSLSTIESQSRTCTLASHAAVLRKTDLFGCWSSSKRVRRDCKGRRLGVLQKHWIMLGLAQAKKDDFIATIHGSSIPWVVRPLGMDTYKIVGKCFVDGVMYGEAVDWTEEDAETLVLI
ncbi:hypothetical protein BDZ45DRAFT_392091 [Acephala macrosclerotiorum]|nr:hypothetical protein BDZ45DRAFT_392091 [Acephala macrosclerotiorum]